MTRATTLAAMACVTALAATLGCQPPGSDQPAGKDGWLTGGQHEKFDTVATHLRGFDMAMVEVGYRYNELYWAGQDRNWEFAEYQAKKIRTAIENGLQRRPKRAESAKPFLELGLPPVLEAIEKQDLEQFDQNFKGLRGFCNSCHFNEKMACVEVVVPTERLSPVHFVSPEQPSEPAPSGDL